MIPQSTIQKIITLIIDNIEAGYYHPDMKSKLKGGENMGISGETMFGIDRTNGAPQFTTKTVDAMFFWNLVDANFGTHHGDTSYYNDMADGRKHVSAAVGAQLRIYVANMILDAYQTYAKYLSDGARKVVESNPKTMLQFLYAVWNGPGNFQKFAEKVNAAYISGDHSPDSYYNIVQDARRKKGGLFAVGADKLDLIAAQLPSSNGNGGGGSSWLWLLIGGVALFGVAKTFFKPKKRRR